MALQVQGILLLVLLCFSFSAQGVDLLKAGNSRAMVRARLNDRKTSSSMDANQWTHSSTKEDDAVVRLVLHEAGWASYVGEYYGSRARIALWGAPNTATLSTTDVSIFVANGGEIIKAGFTVYPARHKDTNLRFYVGWTLDNYTSTWCYDTSCPGFVVDDQSQLYPGQIVGPLSQYNGEHYYMTISIKKDLVTGDWCLYREDLAKPSRLGWWPKTLFKNLTEKADVVEWSAGVSYPTNETSPPLGSGHVGMEGKLKAAYFKDIVIFDKQGNEYSPKFDGVVKIEDKPDCYSVSPFAFSRDECTKFYYGGPAGCKDAQT